MRRPGPRLVDRLVVVLCLTAPGLFGCAKAAPAVVPSLDPLQQLRQDIIAATTLPGVQRAAWGIVVQSLDRNERIFELNPRTLLVPASTAKLVSLASAVDAVGWDYRYETARPGIGADRRRGHPGRRPGRRLGRPVNWRPRRRTARWMGRRAESARPPAHRGARDWR